jgi:hypothetical protein
VITAFAIKLADGRIVVGAIHGAGGLIGGGAQNRHRVRDAIRRATEGRSLLIAEPKPGHAWLYPNATAADGGPREAIDLRGAELMEEL